jgi:hypothetical protein
MAKPPYLHVYAQLMQHDHAFIVGDRESLQLLRDAIDSALAKGHGEVTACTSDGEGYDIAVYKEDDESYWEKAQRPYSHDTSLDLREDAIDPWQLWRKYKRKASV